MGRAQECERICRELLARRPDEVNALRLLAKVAGEEERWGRAERLLLRALELAPGFHDARLDLSRVFKQQDRLEDAVRSAAEAVDGNPRNPNAHYLHASMLALTGRHEEAWPLSPRLDSPSRLPGRHGPPASPKPRKRAPRLLERDQVAAEFGGSTEPGQPENLPFQRRGGCGHRAALGWGAARR
jgi:tetratricopeptide (TPR) repeat protein